MFESRISAGATEKLPGWDKPRAKTSAWPYDMEGHARKFVERYCDLANKKTEQLYKGFQSLFWTITKLKKRKSWKTEVNCQKFAPILYLNDCYLARIGRPVILWPVNKLARSVTKWIQACDRRLARLISYIHHTSEYKQYCYVGNTAKQCRLGLFQDSDFEEDLEDSKFTSGGILCVFGSHTFVPISWMCKKQTSVSHSPTESVIISLDAGLTGWTVFPHLIYGIWSLQFFTETRIRVIKNGETRARTWLRPALSCEQCDSTLSIRVISRFRSCKRSWRFKNQHQAEFCAFLEVEHLYRLVGCARSKRQCLTSPQNQR